MIIITTYTVDLPSVNAESSEIRLNECRNENDNPLIVNYSKILSFLPTHSDLSLNFLVFEPSSHKCLCRETLNPTRSRYHANTGPPSPSRYHPITVTVNEQLFVFKTRRKLEDRAIEGDATTSSLAAWSVWHQFAGLCPGFLSCETFSFPVRWIILPYEYLFS